MTDGRSWVPVCVFVCFVFVEQRRIDFSYHLILSETLSMKRSETLILTLILSLDSEFLVMIQFY